MRVLLVEDNDRLGALISEAIRGHGFAVDHLSSAEEAELAIAANRYDAIILDLMLPGRDGLSIIQPMRQSGVTTPILILTARDGKDAVIQGLNIGADDYLCKPFVMDELIARLRALLRRPGQALGVLLRERNVELDTAERMVRINSVPVDLSRRELGALELLMRRSRRVVQKADMEESLYGFGEEPESNALEVLMHRLRKKLSSAHAEVEIHTLRGVGYILAEVPC